MFLNKLYLIIALLVLSFHYSNTSYAAIYKCKNSDGETIYSSKKCSEQAEQFIPVIEKISKPSQTAEPKEAKPKVDIYITSWCPYCKKAMDYLKSKDIPFAAYDIEKDAKAYAAKQKIFPGVTGVPITVINGQKIQGFSQFKFDEALAQELK